MKAIQLTAFGGPEAMQYLDLADPVALPDEVILDISAIGINYADTHQTENSYLSQQSLPLIPGMEAVGIAPDGKRYLAFTASGAYAQKARASKSSLIPIPDAVSDEQALCMLVQGSTAWLTLKQMAHLAPGESVLIHAAAGGVGTIAIQLAKMWGAKVIAVTSSNEKKALATSLGADAIVDADSADLAGDIRIANGGKRVDVVLEMVGGKTFDQSLLALADFGRLIVYGNASRTAPTEVHPGSLMANSKTISGFWLVNVLKRPEIFAQAITELFTLIATGKLKPVVGQTYGLSQASQAHRAMLARSTTGKIVLDPTR